MKISLEKIVKPVDVIWSISTIIAVVSLLGGLVCAFGRVNSKTLMFVIFLIFIISAAIAVISGMSTGLMRRHMSNK